MTINYIILVHRSPNQIKRLITALQGTCTRFFLHVDKKADILPFKKELENLPDIFYVPDDKRCTGQWGGIELVEATLNTLAIVPHDTEKSYYVLLSGQDYPIRSAAEIETFLVENYGNEYIDIFPMPSKQWWPAPYGMDRVNKYIFRKSSSRYDFVLFPSLLEKEFYKPFFLKELAKLIIRGKINFAGKLFKRRQFPVYLKPYGGHQWWAITQETIQLILCFLKSHSDYLTYHQDSLVPDEIFFQSIVKYILPENAPIKPCLTYANWTRKAEVLPITFTAQDIDELKMQSTEYLYARKFDSDKDKEILALIDQELR
jgi:hypothetical protein